MSEGLVHQVVGQGLAAKLSSRLGEGVINGMLTARIGLACIELCRPLPFSQQTKLSIRMLGQVMNQRSERVGSRGLTPDIAGGIEFDKVSFRYQDGPLALDRISFAIRPGTVVGLVGRSGSGKRTGRPLARWR